MNHTIKKIKIKRCYLFCFVLLYLLPRYVFTYVSDKIGNSYKTVCQNTFSYAKADIFYTSVIVFYFYSGQFYYYNNI